jgi:hypothetical protein
MSCFGFTPLRFQLPLGSRWSPSLAETTSPLPRFALKGGKHGGSHANDLSLL